MFVSFHHASLSVSDIDKAIDFFAQAFGCILHFKEMGMTEQISSMLGERDVCCDIAQLIFPGTRVKLELISFRFGDKQLNPPRVHLLGSMHIAVKVSNFDDTIQKLEVLGATKLGSITNFSDGRAVYLTTPVGAVVELEEML